MTVAEKHPLLTFAIVAYNQEEYIREAVEAAFAQTYSPLQIILSDDCSPDRTFEIMQEMAAAYRGPHKLCLNRNAVNKHIGGHVNEIMKLAEGVLLIGGAGDDISVPHRVEQNFRIWDAAGRPDYCSILSGVEHFGEGLDPWYSPARSPSKDEHPVYLFDDNYGFNGSGQAVTTSTFKLFGHLPEGLVNEDGPIVVRNTLAGSVLFLNEPLVRHRVHNDNTGSAGWAGTDTPEGILKYFHTYLVRREVIVRCVTADLQIAENNKLANLMRYGVKRIKRTQELLHEEQKLCAAGTLALQQGWRQRCAFLASCLQSKTTAGRFMRHSWPWILMPSLFLKVRRVVKRTSVQSRAPHDTSAKKS